MVRQIAPVFFTTDIPATLAYYTGKLGFQCLGGNMLWHCREFVVKDCDGRLLAFGANL